MTFIITGQPVTKKNSGSIVQGGHPRVLPSKTYLVYEREARRQLMGIKKMLGKLPHYTTGVNIEAKYYLQNRAHWPDLTGLMQATADIISDTYVTVNRKKMLSKQWLLVDDRIIKRWDGTCIAGIDKENPRVEITITTLDIDPEKEMDPYIKKAQEAENEKRAK